MTVNDPAGVVITNKDLYDKMVEVEKAVILMTPQAQTLADHENRVRAVEAALPEKLEDRLRSLEKWKWSIPPVGVTAIIAIVQQLLAGKG